MQAHKQALLWILIIVVAIAVALYIVIVRKQGGGLDAGETGAPGNLEDLSGALEDISDAATVDIPSANPYEDVPSLNPVKPANPFENLDTNPFR